MGVESFLVKRHVVEVMVIVAGTQKQSDVPQPDARPTHQNTWIDSQQQVVQDESEGLEDDDVYG